MLTTNLKGKLLQVLGEKLIPWAQEGTPLMLVQPPVQATSEIKVTSYAAAPLQDEKQEISHITAHFWPDEKLNALRVPYLGCVFEGEADLKTGITASRMAQLPQNSLEAKECGRQILSLPERSFFCVPPGVPITGANAGGHWERPCPEESHSRIFWIHILPAGVICHTCTSEGKKHITHPYFFVHDLQIAALAQLMMEELQTRAHRFEAVSQSQLLIMLLRVERALISTEPVLVDNNEKIESLASWSSTQPLSPDADPHSILQRACNYIQTHVTISLSPAIVARHAYVSTSKLNRIFRTELNLSVMQYVTQYRIEKARPLLVGTDLTIAEIGVIVGYRHPAHFSRIFAREVGLSPASFRKGQRVSVTVPEINS